MSALESRILMCSVPSPVFFDTHILPSTVLSLTTTTSAVIPVSGSPLNSVPALHSNPNATVKIYLDFTGRGHELGRNERPRDTGI